MSQPTPEQQAVLDNTARVRVVRSAPGSGKTWLVAELIKQELTEHEGKKDGIAALSFTRVGGDEIRRAVAYELHHPHFVGTLDAFLFRFVVRPFLKQVYPSMATPRLIPAEWQPNRWQKGPNNSKFTVDIVEGSDRRSFNLFNVCFLGQRDQKPIVACKQRDWEPIRPLDSQSSIAVLKAKKELWNKCGWLTHSDVALLASLILGHREKGSAVRAELVRRFPFIIVDELQDTGWFLGKCVRHLLAEPSVRGALIGDPDQAIYEFNGARPDLFERFLEIDGAEELLLGRTLRCAHEVCRSAQFLAQSCRPIEPNLDSRGCSTLLSCTDIESDVRKLRDSLGNHSGNRVIKIIARQTKTVDRIAGRVGKDAPKLRSIPFNHLFRAVLCFRQGRQSAALVGIRAALEYTLFKREGLTKDELLTKGLHPADLKRVCVETLLQANVLMNGDTFETWAERVGIFAEGMLREIELHGDEENDWSQSIRLRRPGGPAKCQIVQDYLCMPGARPNGGKDIQLQTVHAVKGETHDLTVLVCPDPPRNRMNRCPSEAWWSSEEAEQEERRIAYVAMTRTRGDLLVCVTEQCLDRLKEKRTSFVDSFNCMSIDEFIAHNGERAEEAEESEQPNVND